MILCSALGNRMMQDMGHGGRGQQARRVRRARLGILPSPPMSPSITIYTYCALHEVLPKLERAFSICALIYGVSSIYGVNLVVCHIA